MNVRPIWDHACTAWPSALSVMREQGIKFRVSIAGGSTQGAIDALTACFTMDAVLPELRQRCHAGRWHPPAGGEWQPGL